MSKPTFKWADPFLLNDQLSDEERMIRDSARDYCQGKLMPRVLEANRHETFDRAIIHEMGEMGLLGVPVGLGLHLVRPVRIGVARLARSQQDDHGLGEIQCVFVGKQVLDAREVLQKRDAVVQFLGFPFGQARQHQRLVELHRHVGGDRRFGGLGEIAEIRGPEVVTEQLSADGTIKWALRIDGGQLVEINVHLINCGREIITVNDGDHFALMSVKPVHLFDWINVTNPTG